MKLLTLCKTVIDLLDITVRKGCLYIQLEFHLHEVILFFSRSDLLLDFVCFLSFFFFFTNALKLVSTTIILSLWSYLKLFFFPPICILNYFNRPVPTWNEHRTSCRNFHCSKSKACLVILPKCFSKNIWWTVFCFIN